MSIDSTRMRVEVLGRYLSHTIGLSAVKDAFERFPHLSFDEEQVDATVLGHCTRFVTGSITEAALRRNFQELVDYLNRQ